MLSPWRKAAVGGGRNWEVKKKISSSTGNFCAAKEEAKRDISHKLAVPREVGTGGEAHGKTGVGEKRAEEASKLIELNAGEDWRDLS